MREVFKGRQREGKGEECGGGRCLHEGFSISGPGEATTKEKVPKKRESAREVGEGKVRIKLTRQRKRERGKIVEGQVTNQSQLCAEK
mmetsp:Transcript_13518/g.26799  ORF Transcript_13518/g.26799 Transcript_13518/m.26799 type:complete len:87 (+) Transcript_13518:663-923(+)